MAASTRALFVSFLAVVAAFIGSTIWAQQVARRIDEDALLISRAAAPGIEVMSGLRAELRALELEVLRAADTGEGARVNDSRIRIDALMARALALPSDARESRLLGRLQAEMRALDVAAERALEQARAGHVQTAHETLGAQVRPRGDAAADLARQLVEYDAQLAAEAARRIESARARANRFAYQLDALSALLALVAAGLALRAVRQVQRVQDEHRAEVERKAEELEQFAGRVAHDVLSPLGAVSLSLGLAQQSATSTVKDALARGQQSLGRVRRIVDGLLEFARAGARPEAGARAEVQPTVTGLEQEIRPFAVKHGAALRIEPPPACSVACSQGVLLSLLSNLMTNAIKHLGDSTRREVELRVKRQRGRVLFEVEDSGPGIPASLGERIFEPYVRGPKAGTPGIGLGLATVKRLVESHGGSVGVRAAPRAGALFWFELEESALPEEILPPPGESERARGIVATSA